jgi:hypothetical protein
MMPPEGCGLGLGLPGSGTVQALGICGPPRLSVCTYLPIRGLSSERPYHCLDRYRDIVAARSALPPRHPAPRVERRTRHRRTRAE